MDPELDAQMETTINALRQAHARIESALQTLRKQHSRYGRDYDRTHVDIAQIIRRERHMRRVAAQRARAEAQPGSAGRSPLDGG